MDDEPNIVHLARAVNLRARRLPVLAVGDGQQALGQHRFSEKPDLVVLGCDAAIGGWI